MKEESSNRKVRYTRKVLRDSLVELLITKPISRITITELCKKADINRTTFYAHYKDQFDLLNQVEEETLSSFEDILRKHEDKRGRRELLQLTEEIVSFMADNGNSIQVLLSENGDIRFQKKLFNRFIRMDQVMNYFSSDEDDRELKEYSYIFVVNGTLGLIQHWLQSDKSVPEAQLAKMLVQLTQISRN